MNRFSNSVIDTTTISIQSTQITDEKKSSKTILSTNPTKSVDIKQTSVKITSKTIQTTIKPTTYFTQTTKIIKNSEKASTISIFPITIHPNQCEERQLIDDRISKMINVIPNDLPIEEKVNFQPISIGGVSFPENDLKPIIIIDFGRSTQIKSIIIPRDKTLNANVEQFQVTFYSLNANKINEYPILSNLSPKNNKNIPIELNSTDIPSNISILWIELIIIRTIDDTSPKGLILDIKGCTQTINNGLIIFFFFSLVYLYYFRMDKLD